MKYHLHEATKKTILLLTLVLALSCRGYSQSVWFQEPAHTTTIGANVLFPSFDDDIATNGSPPAVLHLYSYIPVNDRLALQLNLPVSHYSFGDESDIALGNPYIGLQAKAHNPNLKFDLGLRLPVVSETQTALLTGLLIENYNIGTFIPHAVSIVSNIHYRYVHHSGLIFRVGGGPEALIPTKGDAAGELYIKYYGQLLYNINKLTFGGGLTGLLLTTENNLSLSQRTIHNIGLTGSYKFSRATVGAYIRTSLNDDVTNLVHYVVGLNIAIHL